MICFEDYITVLAILMMRFAQTDYHFELLFNFEELGSNSQKKVGHQDIENCFINNKMEEKL
jgi:hypothetical protein